MQKKLEDYNTVARQVAFESVDIFVALVPDMFGDQLVRQLLRPQKRRMHAHDENFLVIRTVEDAYLSARRNALMSAPEILVIQFLVAERLERVDVATLQVHTGHDVLDRAVFSGGIHGLKDQQQCPAVLSIEFFLHVAKQAYTSLQNVFAVLFAFDSVRVGGVVIL